MRANDAGEVKRSLVAAEDGFMSEFRSAADGWFSNLLVSLKSSRGASLVEYALLIGLITVVCITAMAFLGRATEPAFTDAGNGFQNQNQN